MKKLTVFCVAMIMLLALTACGTSADDGDAARSAYTTEANRITEEIQILQDGIALAESALKRAGEPRDPATKTALEAAVQEAKDSIQDVPDMPEEPDAIRSETEKLKVISYDAQTKKLMDALMAFEDSREETESFEPNGEDSVSESTVSDGCYITALLGSYHGQAVDGSGNSYSIAWEDPLVVVTGSCNYNQDPDLTYFTDSTDLLINAPIRYPVTAETKYVLRSGDGEEELTREEFIATAQDYMDRDNGPALIVSVRNGTAVQMMITS